MKFCFIRNLRFLVCLMLAVTLLPGTASVRAQPSAKTVKVIGSSAIRNKNIAKAREDAISDCLVSAVSKVALETLPLDALVHGFQKLDDILYGHTSNFVQGYKVLAEFRSGKTYRVMLEATVLSDGLKELEKHLPAGTELTQNVDEKKFMPTVLFLIAEQNLADRSPQYWWGGASTSVNAVSEHAMSEKMREKGFAVIKHGYLSSDAEGLSRVAYPPDLDNEEAIKIGARLKAEVVIVGTSVVYKVSDATGDTQSFSGTVSVRAIRTATGEEIASSLQTAVKRSADETQGSQNALSSAGRLAAKALSSQIGKAREEFSGAGWEPGFDEIGDSETSGMVELIVSGTSQLGNFVRFRRALSEIPGVKDIHIREMKSDEAFIRINFQGNIRRLGDALKLKTFKLFSVKLYDVSQSTLRIELVPR